MFFSKLTKFLLFCSLILSVSLNCNPKRKVKFPKWLIEKYPEAFKKTYSLETLLTIQDLLQNKPSKITGKDLANIIIFNDLCNNANNEKTDNEETDSEDADSEGDTTD
ncbi:MAG: hypothetical protein SZ59_C0002G0307 [candidate division TM6 bacterium GW2011_GWF2_28_16]|nr:MAG: hypothetical protein SZ59_C0002G0307 [candidate division TM6 bacterium GW2011_GWF2_28_16]